MMMMMRWALVSSWLKMMMTLRLMDLSMFPPEEEEDEELELLVMKMEERSSTLT
jgi:hypothetical protein